MKMFNKKIYMILLLFIVSICTISAVSASENVTDTVAIDDVASDDIATSIDEDLSSEIEDDTESQDVLASQDDSSLSASESDDVLSGSGIMASQYALDLNNNGYEITSNTGGNIVYYLQPYAMAPMNAYNFYFEIYPIIGGEVQKDSVFTSITFASDTDRNAGNRYYTIPANKLAPGLYQIYAKNSYMTASTLDSTTLKVKGNAVITASDYNSNYNSGSPLTIKVTNKDTGAPLQGIDVQIALSNGQSATYTTNAQGQIILVPYLGAGTYSATYSLSSSFNYISAASVKKSITINKSPATVKANEVSAYKGSKITLKATVTSDGKNVNEGQVIFKINGKEYTVDVKDGVAKKTIKLSKVKKYDYTATFKDGNYQDASSSSTATIKNKIATKIIVKNQKAYRGNPKAFYVTIKTASGKIVKSGKVKIIDTVKVNKKGKAKFYATSNWNYIKQVGNTVYFKNSVTKTLTVKYIPSSDAYKSSSTKMKITMKYKCTACGSTKTHSHNGMTFVVKS